MKKIITLLLLIASLAGYGQEITRDNVVPMGIGLHFADPQGEFKSTGYNAGIGPYFNFFTPSYPDMSWLNFQFGFQTDFANMGWKTYRGIELPPEMFGKARLRVKNSMYGLFVMTRINFGNYYTQFRPHIDLIFGHRSFSTGSVRILNSPGLNRDYEKREPDPRIVFTRMMHYGAKIGFEILLEENTAIEFGATYTIGNPGTVLPLKDISRSPGGDDIDYSRHQKVNTDMLLFYVGIRAYVGGVFGEQIADFFRNQ